MVIRWNTQKLLIGIAHNFRSTYRYIRPSPMSALSLDINVECDSTVGAYAGLQIDQTGRKNGQHMHCKCRIYTTLLLQILYALRRAYAGLFTTLEAQVNRSVPLREVFCK